MQATANLAVPRLPDRLSLYPLASNSEAAFWPFAIVTLLARSAVIILRVGWVVLVGLASQGRER